MIDRPANHVVVSLMMLLASLAPVVAGAASQPATVVQAATNITAAAYPNADSVVLDKHIQVRYNADGTYTQRDEHYSKILTEKGKRDWQTLSSYFTLPYNTTRFEAVEIIRPDGRVEVIDHASLSRTMISRSQMGSNIFNPNSKILQVSVPGLEINDIIHYVLVDDFVKTRVPNSFSDYLTFEGTEPVHRLVYEIDAPKQLPLARIVSKDTVPGTLAFTETPQGERILYRWEATGVPRIYPEPHMPDMHTVVQRTLVSTIPDWEALSRWYWNLSEPHLLTTTPAMVETVAQLTKDLTDPRQQIEAIFYYVSQRIRYLGITAEAEAPGYEPHDVSKTFERKHGVCRDKAALLVAMLRLKDFAAFPVIIHNGPKKESEVPQPFFNHAVVAVDLGDRDYLLMDPTDENTRELFPSYLNDQSYLVARPEGETLRTSPISPAEQNLVTAVSRGRISADGSLRMHSTLTFAGINDNVYRGHFSGIKPEQRERFFQGLIKRIVPGARLTRLVITPVNILNTSEPLRVELEYHADDILIRDPEQPSTIALLPLPQAGTAVGWVNFILGRLGLEERQFPLRTETACGVVETLELELAEELGQIQTLPDYEPIHNAVLSWDQSVTRTAQGLRSESQFKINTVEVTPAQYAELKDNLATIEYHGRKMPLLASVRSYEAAAAGSQAAADAPAAADSQQDQDVMVLDETVQCQVIDATSWATTTTVRKQILTYAGKKTNSDLRINFNPSWEEVHVHAARVIQPDGTVSTVEDQEMNLMDQGWVGSAPRYPAGKTLVVSLPGVDVGSVIEYSIEHVYRHRPFFELGETFRYQAPLEQKTVHVRLPLDLAVTVQSLQTDAVARSASQSATEVEHVFRSTRAQAAVKQESDLPPWWSFNPTVVLSSGTWPAYARLVGAALQQATSNSAQVKALAERVIGAADDDSAKLQAIRDFVARQIRRAGPGLADLPLSAVSGAERTLADGYGNSTDQAVLLYSLLAAAGFEPQFIGAISAPLDPELQQQRLEMARQSLLNTVLVRVKLDGAWVYLNDTDQYAALGTTGHAGHAGLLLPQGTFETIQPPEAKQDRIDTHYELELQHNGAARITRTRHLSGIHYNVFRQRFAEMPPEERRRHHQELLAGIAQSASAAGELITDYSVYPAVEQFTAEVPRYAVRDDNNNNYYFQLPASLRGLLRLPADSRVNPLYWATPRQETITVDITLPDEFAYLELTPVRGNNANALAWQAPDNGGNVRISSQITPVAGSNNGAVAKVRFVHQVDLQPALIPVAHYGELLTLQQRLSHPRTRTLLLRSAAATQQR